MSQQNLAVVQSFYDAFNRGDLAGMMAVFDQQIEIVEAPSLPYGGVYRGIEGVEELLAKVGATWSVFEASQERLIAHGDEVFAFLQARGKVHGNDRLIEFPVFELWRLRDAKVVAIQPFYWDTGAIAGAWAERTPQV